jgi:hypothetical protein
MYFEKKTDNVVVVDCLGELGHQNFNENIKNHIREKFNECEFVSNSHRLNSLLRFKNFFRIPYYTINFLNTICVFLKYRRQNVILLSYNLIVLSLVSRLVHMKGDVYVFEHNTFVPDKPVKLMFFRMIDKRFIHLAFEEFIVEKIITFHRRAKVFPHPKPILAKETKDIDYLMISSTVSQADVDAIYSILSKTNYKSFIKDRVNPGRKINNTVTFDFLHDYQKTIARTRNLIIPQKFNFRVSGVFYDAIMNVDTIYMQQCKFSEQMELKYPDKVEIFRELKEIIPG